jgi:osmotically inducible lipoprotein OsmB
LRVECVQAARQTRRRLNHRFRAPPATRASALRYGNELKRRTEMRKFLMIGALTGTMAALSACGQSTGDRALSGGGLGAAAGAGIGAITGGSVLGGAVLGGAAGAAAGALTGPDQVDLGRPAWRR